MAVKKVVTRDIKTNFSSYVGKIGDVFVDSDSSNISISDGSTAGGIPINTGGSSGPFGTVQISNGSGGFIVSDFSDNLTVAGSATIALVDNCDGFGDPGVIISGPTPIVSMAPSTGSSSGILYFFGYGVPGTLTFFTSEGEVESPTKTISGLSLGEIQFFGNDGGGAGSYVIGGQLNVIARSDFSITPTTSIDLTNASNLGLHIAADGTFSIDGLLVEPSHTPASATDTGTAGTIAWDSNFLYVCVATNSWKRMAISAW